MPTSLPINGQSQTLDLPNAMPLLWALREGLNLTGAPSLAAGLHPVARAACIWMYRQCGSVKWRCRMRQALRLSR